ncbi:hypothetical protein GGI12_004561 [Dipsacomyces acuminosporus]|nr:hypothetical protein GGI12_004561 [Dipsacomyces acuminosporus]
MATMKTLSTKSQENLLAASSSKDQSTTSTAKPSTELLTTSSPTNDQDAKAATESESKTAAKQQTGVGKAVGLSLMDKVATIGKRGILGWSKSKAEFTTTPNTTTSTTSTTSTTTNTTNTTNTTIAATKEASAAETKVVAQKKDLIPKVFSIFSKLVGFQSS